MTSDFLAAAAGIVLSLIFSYVPGVAPWFAEKDATTKRLITLGLILGISILAFLVTCFNIIIPGITLTCSAQGAVDLGQVILAAAIANQTAFLLSPEPAWKKVLREQQEITRVGQMMVSAQATRLTPKQ